MEPRYDTRGSWTVTARGTSSTYYTPRNLNFRTIFDDREDREKLRYDFLPFYSDEYKTRKKSESEKKEDWSKSKEVDEFLEGFEVK